MVYITRTLLHYQMFVTVSYRFLTTVIGIIKAGAKHQKTSKVCWKVYLSGQQPWSVYSQPQPSLLGPVAIVALSGQHPKRAY